MPVHNPLNVTVVVPPTLRGAMDGRKQVQLGVPANADVGDVLETLLKLYPKLLHHVASDRKVVTSTLTLFLHEQGSLDLASRRTGLREGTRLYLSAAMPKPRVQTPRG
jgi:hypothetical protein